MLVKRGHHLRGHHLTSAGRASPTQPLQRDTLPLRAFRTKYSGPQVLHSIGRYWISFSSSRISDGTHSACKLMSVTHGPFSRKNIFSSAYRFVDFPFSAHVESPRHAEHPTFERPLCVPIFLFVFSRPVHTSVNEDVQSVVTHVPFSTLRGVFPNVVGCHLSSLMRNSGCSRPQVLDVSILQLSTVRRGSAAST
ncbi:hypothetical protein BC834DRAFT_669404 [Gloeopeniophorella convolvens]|nr:hypothetical protein BC834DRAFT_669404 [Gloeopeniophorella convolvens]